MKFTSVAHGEMQSVYMRAPSFWLASLANVIENVRDRDLHVLDFALLIK